MTRLEAELRGLVAAALGVGVFEIVYDVGDPHGERTDTAGWSGLGS